MSQLIGVLGSPLGASPRGASAAVGSPSLAGRAPGFPSLATRASLWSPPFPLASRAARLPLVGSRPRLVRPSRLVARRRPLSHSAAASSSRLLSGFSYPVLTIARALRRLSPCFVGSCRRCRSPEHAHGAWSFRTAVRIICFAAASCALRARAGKRRPRAGSPAPPSMLRGVPRPLASPPVASPPRQGSGGLRESGGRATPARFCRLPPAPSPLRPAGFA